MNNSNHQRRNNIIISGIPPEISNDQLEPAVIKILGAVDVVVTEEHINGVHRLWSPKNDDEDDSEPISKPTIVSFVNRRYAERALKNKKNLIEVNMDDIGLPDSTELYINENVCPRSQHLAWMGRILKKKKKIHSSWMNKGTVFFRKTANSDLIKIEHFFF